VSVKVSRGRRSSLQDPDVGPQVTRCECVCICYAQSSRERNQEEEQEIKAHLNLLLRGTIRPPTFLPYVRSLLSWNCETGTSCRPVLLEVRIIDFAERKNRYSTTTGKRECT
jgi:hypothetical protein